MPLRLDEHISTTDITIPPILIEGPITRSRARQLKQQVNSFLCSSSCENENRLLPNCNTPICKTQSNFKFGIKVQTKSEFESSSNHFHHLNQAEINSEFISLRWAESFLPFLFSFSSQPGPTLFSFPPAQPASFFRRPEQSRTRPESPRNHPPGSFGPSSRAPA